MTRRSTLLLLLFASTSSVYAGDYGPPPPAPGGNSSCQSGDVIIEATAGNRFSPANLTIPIGTTVCFRNNSSMPHNVHVPGIFRCSANCASPYNANDPGSAPAGNWVMRLLYNEAATVDYHCDAHLGLGMTGRIIVQGNGGGGDAPGTLAFSTGTYTVGESGNATITVRRNGGDDGAASVAYATTNGTATAGSDYTSRSGTLNWADGDDGNKTFTVPILSDTVDEANETVLLTLSAATGATLGSPSSATLSVTDDDGGGNPGAAPAAPTGLVATPVSTTEIGLSWVDASTNESQFLIERKLFGGTFTQVGTAAANTPLYPEDGLDPATYYLFRVRASNATGDSAYSNETGATTKAPLAPCVADDDTLCLVSGRFQVEIDWRFGNGTSGQGKVLSLTDQSGVMYFTNPNNLELLLKILNGCTINQHYWVFYAATTNQELVITVTDTQTGDAKTYTNTLGVAALPVQDTGAFATCP